MERAYDYAKLFDPGSVAIYGATASADKFAGRIINNLINNGYQGLIYPINPKYEEVLGHTCYASILEIEKPVDVAVVAIPAKAILEVVRDCVLAKVKYMVVISGGFAESGPQGKAIQEEMLALAKAGGMRIVGPNGMGLFSTKASLVLSSSFVFQRNDLPRGGIAFLSQSGALMVAVLDKALDAGAAYSYAVSLGNEADLQLPDFMEYMLDDPETKVISAYIEGFNDTKSFIRAADKALNKGKPIVALKIGKSDQGSAAAASHTAHIAGSYQVYQAFCRQKGIINVDNIDGLFNISNIFDKLPPATGRGIALLTPSGGACGIIADRFESMGLSLPKMSEDCRGKISCQASPLLAANPVDLATPHGCDIGNAVKTVVAAIDNDPAYDAVLVVLTTIPDFDKAVDSLIRAAQSSKKPFIFYYVPGRSCEKGKEAIMRAGQLLYTDLDACLDALRAWVEYSEKLKAHRQNQLNATAEEAGQVPAFDMTGLIENGEKVLTEHRAKEVLARIGFSVTRERLAKSREEALAAAESIGYPLALKLISPKILHKSDRHMVKLDIVSPQQLEEVYNELWQSALAIVGPEDIEGILVQEMVKGGRELILGYKYDAQFGPTVLLGWGGTLVEVIKEYSLGVGELSRSDAEEMITNLPASEIFKGLRGQKEADVAALIEAILVLSRFGQSMGDSLLELDINPLAIMAKGQGVKVLDARMIFK